MLILGQLRSASNKAYFAHVSQNTTRSFASYHDRVEKFRGREFNCDRAEAFIHLRRRSNDIF